MLHQKTKVTRLCHLSVSIVGCLVLVGGCCQRVTRKYTRPPSRHVQNTQSQRQRPQRRAQSFMPNLLSKSIFTKYKSDKPVYNDTPVRSRFAKKRNENVDSTTRARAMMAAARTGRINLFGETTDRRRTAYNSRTNVSLERHTVSHVGADYDVDIDPHGTRMVFASTRHHLESDLYMKTIGGVAITQLTSDPASDIQPVFSPDGQRVAFASNRSGSWDIWVVSVSGGPPAQVTRGMADEIHPSWSPDGSEVVYCSLPAEGGQWELWITSAMEGGTSKFIGYGLFPDWSPSGETIVFQRARERGSRWFSIWTLTMVNGEPKYPTEIAASSTEAMILPAWNHDGTRIAFASTSVIPVAANADVMNAMTNAENGIFDIWVTYADGRGKFRLTDGQTVNFAPAFDLDGKIYFTSNRSGNENIWSMTPGDHPAFPVDGEMVTHQHQHRHHSGTQRMTGEQNSAVKTVSDGL